MNIRLFISLTKQFLDRYEISKGQLILVGIGILLMIFFGIIKSDSDLIDEYLGFMVLFSLYILFPHFWQYFVLRINRASFTDMSQPNAYIPISVGILGYIFGTLMILTCD